MDQENEVTCNINVLLFHGNLFYTCMLCTDDCWKPEKCIKSWESTRPSKKEHKYVSHIGFFVLAFKFITVFKNKRTNTTLKMWSQLNQFLARRRVMVFPNGNLFLLIYSVPMSAAKRPTVSIISTVFPFTFSSKELFLQMTAVNELLVFTFIIYLQDSADHQVELPHIPQAKSPSQLVDCNKKMWVALYGGDFPSSFEIYGEKFISFSSLLTQCWFPHQSVWFDINLMLLVPHSIG